MAQTIVKKDTKTKVKEVAVKAVKPVEVATPKETKTAKYKNNNIQISPRKLRLFAESIKKLKPAEVLVQLKFTNSKSARVMVTAVKNIIADAKANFGLNPETLKFESIRVDEGLKIKRMDKSHGARFASGRIVKRHSRLEIIVKGETK